MTDWTHVQGASTTTGSGFTNSLSFSAPVTSGNIVRGGVLLGSSQYVTSVTDDKGNAYRVTSRGADGSLSASLFRSTGPITNSPTTITVKASSQTGFSNTTFWIIIDEFTPPTGKTAFSLDGFASALGTTGLTTGNFTTAQSDDLIYAVSFDAATSTPGAGFTAGTGSGTNLMSEWKIQSTPSSTVAATLGTNAGTTWLLVDATAPVAPTTWEPVQSQIQRTVTNTLTGSIAFDFPVAPGNMVVGVIASDNSSGSLANLTSLQDNLGHNYQLIAGTAGNGDRQTFWSNGLLFNGPQTITADFSVTQDNILFLLTEFAPPPGAGSVSIDGTPTNVFNATTGGTTSVTTPPVTTTNSNDLAYTWGDMLGSQAVPTNGFAPLVGEFMTWCSAYQVWSIPQTTAATWDHGSSTGSENASLAVFHATASSGGGGAAGSPGLIGPRIGKLGVL